jgi:diphthine-ammonia ligase
LFSKRLELEDTEVVITDPEPYPVAYLRVARGKLVEKEGWVKPGVEELRAMLGLGGDEGVEGLDEAGRELLYDLSQSRSGLRKDVGEEEQLDMSGLRLSADSNEEVRFNKRDKWFGASINGVTRGDESIGEELKRCFDSIQGKNVDTSMSIALTSRDIDNPRSIPAPPYIPHHPPLTFNVPIHTRQCSLLYILRYIPPFPSYCCRPPTLWDTYTT